MAFIAFIYKYGIWISVPAFIFFVTIMVMSIVGVVRTVRKAVLFSVPLVERQEVEFSEPGRVVLCMEGPMLSSRFAKLEYELTDPYGSKVKSRPVLLRARTTGFTKARMELRVYEITQPGRHLFQINNLGGEKPSDTEHRMVFTRPNLARSLAYVMGIVFGGMLTILSLVLFLMRLFNVAGT